MAHAIWDIIEIQRGQIISSYSTELHAYNEGYIHPQAKVYVIIKKDLV